MLTIMKKLLLGILISFIIIIVFRLFDSHCNSKRKLYYITSEIEFHLDDDCDYKSYYVASFYDKNENKEYIFRLNRNNKLIEVYDLNKSEFTKKIQFDFIISGFFVEDNNLIYVLQDEKNIINLCNYNGKIIESYYINALHNENVQRFAYSYTEQPFIKHMDYFIFNSVVNIDSRRFYQFCTIGIYNLRKNIITLAAPFPNSMNDGFIRFGFYPYYDLFENKILCSFACDHYLYLYDFNGNLIDKYECRSKYIDNFNVADEKKLQDRAYNEMIQITSPFYANLIFDKYQRLIYRVVLHSQNFNDSLGLKKDYFSRSWSLIIMDKNFKLLDEIIFEKDIYNFQEILVTKSGLLISMNNENNPNFKVDKLLYKLMRFRYD